MSFSASFNGRPLTNIKTSGRKARRSADVPRTPGYYNILKNAKGSSTAFAKAIVALSKSRG